MTLPKILVLDDRCGWSNHFRQRMCNELHLKNGTDGGNASGTAQLLGEAYFHSCQRLDGTKVVNDVSLAINEVAKGWDPDKQYRWALVLLDLQFDEGTFEGGQPDPRYPASWPSQANPKFGLEILQAMASKWPDPQNRGRTEIPVVVLSTRPRGQLEAQLNNLGNLDYLEGDKTLPTGLGKRFADRFPLFGLFEDGPILSANANGQLTATRSRTRLIVGKSLSILGALREARQAAPNDAGCLILGERGSGKELFAECIHQLSNRASHPYKALNCANLGETTLVAELFGFAPNSGYANAPPRGREGLFEAANNGTIFLDEVGDLPPACQAQVLHAIQKKKEVQRLGATQPVSVNVRVIAATNMDLEEAARVGKFRPDLLDRLRAFVISLPAVRARPDDIPRLFDFFLKRETQKDSDGIWPKQIEEAAYTRLKGRSWPGNVREIEQVATVIATKRKYATVIVVNDIPVAGGDDTESTIEQLRRRITELEAQPATSGSARGPLELQRLLEIMDSVEIPDGPPERLTGKLQELGEKHVGLIQRLLEAALSATKVLQQQGMAKASPEETTSGSSQATGKKKRDKAEVLGDLSPTRAFNLLLQNQWKTTDVRRNLRQLAELVREFYGAELAKPDTQLAKVVKWASDEAEKEAEKNKRRKKASEGSKGSQGERPEKEDTESGLS